MVNDSTGLSYGLPLGIALATWLAYKLSRIGSRETYLPPGPPTTLILGNALIFPKTSPQHRFTEWAKEYGGIVSLKLANSTVVVLNSYEDIRQLLQSNSAVTSDRPPFHFTTLYDGPGNNIVLARYSDRWRALRRAAQQVLSSQATRSHLPIQEAESVQLLYNLSTDPEEKIRENLRRYSTSVIMSVMFGVRIARSSSTVFKEFWELLDRLVYLSAPTSHPPVDLVPILKYVPERWASWKTECRDLWHFQRRVFGGMLRPVQERLARDEGNGCFMEEVFQRAEEWNLDDDQLLYFGALMIEAGSETTSTFLSNFVLCLAANPQVLEKAQEEIDRVVGRDRLPRFDDFEDLPYLQAIVHETHRFRPVTPIGIPHANIEDIHHGKYMIPKGTMIIQNTWAVFHDETIFKNPHLFQPERFLENPELCKYTDLVFGSGRRFCVGVHLAKSSLLINAMNLVWAFKIEKARTKEGKVIEPNLKDYLDGLAAVPKELRCSIKPRSSHHEDILRQAFRNTAATFELFERDLNEDDRRYVQECRDKA